MNQEKNDRQNKRHLIIFSVFFIAILVIITLLTRYSKNPEELGAENSNNEKVVFQEEESVNDVGEGKEGEEEETTEEVDTSNWLTYRNEEYGFEMRYPEGWEVTNYDKTKTYYKGKGIGLRPLNFHEPIFFVKIFEKNSADLTNYFINLYGNFSNKKTKIQYLSDTYPIGEYPAQKIVIEFITGKIYYGIIEYNDYLYLIDFDFIFKKDAETPTLPFPLDPSRRQVKVILTTFKFLD